MTSSTDKKQDQKIKDLQAKYKELEAKSPEQRSAEEQAFLRENFDKIEYGTGDQPQPQPDPDPEPKPEPVPDNGNDNFTKDGVMIVATIKQGGYSCSGGKLERSVHDQSNEKNIPRDSIYNSTNKYGPNDVVNTANVLYLQTNLIKPDQVTWKVRGGDHTDSAKRQGRCYAIGPQINPGSKTTGHLAKEVPEHSTTPPFPNKIQYANLNVPDLNNKPFGLQVLSYNTAQGSVMIECWLDLSILDKQLSEITAPPNNWVKWFTAEDKGDWQEAPYLKNQGVENGGKNLLEYVRIDHVGKDQTQFKYINVVEIVPRS